MKSKSILSKRVICVVGVIVGIAIIIGGFVISKYFNGMLSSGPTTSTTFGADYYTKQYGATTDILWDIYNVFIRQERAYVRSAVRMRSKYGKKNRIDFRQGRSGQD